MLLGKFVRIFNSLVGIKNHIEKFIAEEPESFRKHGIFKLREEKTEKGFGTKWYLCNSMNVHEIET